jgi:hypothetical protein
LPNSSWSLLERMCLGALSMMSRMCCFARGI